MEEFVSKRNSVWAQHGRSWAKFTSESVSLQRQIDIHGMFRDSRDYHCRELLGSWYSSALRSKMLPLMIRHREMSFQKSQKVSTLGNGILRLQNHSKL